jgi:phytanoyl-CoA hydroxylase
MNASTAAKPSTPHFTVTKEQVRFYVDNGYLVIPDLVSPPELERLKTDIVTLARGGYPCESLKPLPAHMNPQEIVENILCIHQPHFISPVIAEFVKHEKICSVLSQIIGAHLAHWDGSAKCMQSMLFVKPPDKPGQAWHQDEMYIPTRDRSLCGAWIAIDDATEANGCLRVIPGSHQQGYNYPIGPSKNLEDFDTTEECYGFETNKETLVEVKAGSVVFFNGYLLHCSRRNRSNVFRRALVSHYMNAYSLLPWFSAKEQESSIARADDRRIVPVAGIDPYAHKGITPYDNNVYLRGYIGQKKIEVVGNGEGEAE